jgi:hypothetical protein
MVSYHFYVYFIHLITIYCVQNSVQDFFLQISVQLSKSSQMINKENKTYIMNLFYLEKISTETDRIY